LMRHFNNLAEPKGRGVLMGPSDPSRGNR
jgi:hypothetical protein